MFTQELKNEITLIFKWWLESGEKFNMPQYTEENCEKAESIVRNLLAELEKLGPSSTENEKVEAFQASVIAMNTLSDQVLGLIETGEREQLCEIYDKIAVEVGLIPECFGSGDGIVSEWRNW